ncbi:MAG: HTTM domain-containing protein [Isosphaeraceae bacterium]
MSESAATLTAAPPAKTTSPARPDTSLAFARALFRPVDVAPLVYLRIVFGTVMLWEVVRHFRNGWVRHLYVEPVFHFTYPGFDWVRPWPGNGMYVHFFGLGLMAAMVAVGLCYRLAATVFFLGFAYVFLLCQSLYLNHYYLILLVAFLLPFLPAQREWSLDVWLHPERRNRWAPAWSLWLLRAQFGIVYVYGGLAKLNADWLRGEPLRTWLARRTDLPVVGPWLTEEWVVLGMSHGGLLLDLFVVPMLFWRPTRLLAVAALVAFHAINATLFSIGVFPWLMLAVTPIFFPPDTLRRVLGGRAADRAEAPPSTASPIRRAAILAALGVYLGVQVLVPLRHHLYPGEVSWTEEGHNFSWHMKLRDKLGTVQFAAIDPATGGSTLIDPADYLTPRQLRKMSTRPEMILRFAHFLADVLREDGHPRIQIRALAYATLNGRPLQRLVGPDVDLAAQPRVSLWPSPWIVPLRASDDL